jgi:uncharacterized protein YutE (UPF0331/DUF86 family)
MTDPVLISRKLGIMKQFVARARRRLPEDVAELHRDEDLQDALAMSLLVAIQEAIDVAFHLLADEGWGLPDAYGEAFRLLGERGLLSADLATRLSIAAGLRNRLAHGYASVEVDRLWRETPAGLDDLDAFARAISDFLEQSE